MMTDSVIHVLSIEDNPADAALIQKKLAEAQRVGWDLPRFEVEHVAQLQPALERLEDGDRFDVVLSDLDLPDSQAGETVATLREHIPHMPLVVLTGREDEALAQKSVRAGVQDYLYKNEATGSLLARTMMYAIERQQAHDELERHVEERTSDLQAEVAERKRAEQALRESEEKFRTLFNSAGDAIFIHDLEGNFLEINQEAIRRLGYSREELLQMRPSDIDAPDYAPLVSKRIEQIKKTGHVIFETTHITKDGETIPIELSSRMIQYGEERAILSIARDITERKRAEEVLRRERDLLARITETSPVGITIVDRDGQITFANKCAEKVLGLTKDQITQRTYNEPAWRITDYEGNPFPETELPFKQVIATGQAVYDVRHAIEWPDGRRVLLSINAAPLFDDAGRLNGMVSTLEDVTRRVQAEERVKHLNLVLRTISNVNQIIIKETDRDRLIQEVCDKLTETRGYYNAWIALFNASGGAVMTVESGLGADFSALREQLHRGELSACGQQALSQSEVVVTENPASTCADCPLAASYAGRGAMTVRLEHDGDVYGLLTVSVPAHFTTNEEERSLFQEVAGDIAFALHSIELEEKRKRAEEALRESEKRFRTVSELVSDYAYAVHVEEDGSLTLDWATEGFTQDTGRELSRKIAGAYSNHNIYPDDAPILRQRVQTLLSNQEVVSEYRIVTASGEVRWLRDYGRPIWDEVAGRVVRIIGAAQDITERKRAEDALEESLTRYADITARVLVGVYVFWIRADGEMAFEYVSDRWCEIHQLRRKDVLADVTVANDLVHPDDRENFMALNRQAYSEQTRFSWEGRFIVGGETRWLQIESTCEAFDNGDTRWFGVTQDITERKQMEEALRESEERFRTIINALPQFVAYNDKDLIYRFVNQAYQEKFDVEPEEVIGKTLPEVIGEEAFEEARPHVEKALRGEQVRYHERYDYAIGGTRDIDGILVPDIAADGEVRGYYAVLTDITPYMEMQEELRQTTERLRIIREIDTAILCAQSPQEIAVATLERLHHLIPCRRTSIAEIAPGQQQGRDMIVLINGDVQTEPEPWYPLAAVGEQLITAIQQGQTYLVNDIAALETLSPLEKKLKADGVRSYVSVPLLVQGAPVGALNLGSETPDFFQSSHLRILEEIAVSLAVALQQARLLEQTQRDAETKALLLREVNHRVKNNLNAIIGLLYVERRHAPPEALPAYTSIIEDLTQRITSLAEVHQMLSSVQWAPLNLSALAERIIQSTVQGSSDDVDVTLDLAPASAFVQPAQAQHLAVILSELTTNTLKHAASDRDTVRITVQIAQGDGMTTLSYRDDGPGYPEDVLSLERHSAGLDIIKRSVRKNLRGEIALRNEGGAITEIRFKTEEEKEKGKEYANG